MNPAISTKTLTKTSVIFILGLLAFLALASPSYASTSQPEKYTGYEVTGPYTTIRVAGSWIVPTANCNTTPNSVSNISVIIDGIANEKDAMEIGTYQNCHDGKASYGAFINIYPVTSYYGNDTSIQNFKVHPGDVIEAQGTWRKTALPVNWNTNIVDESTCIQLDTDAHSPSGFTPAQNSGAIILSADGHTLTSLSTIFLGREYTASAKCSGSGIQGTHNTDITGPQHGSSTFLATSQLKGYNLITFGGIVGTNLTPLADSGTSFEITS